MIKVNINGEDFSALVDSGSTESFVRADIVKNRKWKFDKSSKTVSMAYAIVEAIRKWKHYLLYNNFQLVTDQEAVSFIFDKKRMGKVKNDIFVIQIGQISEFLIVKNVTCFSFFP